MATFRFHVVTVMGIFLALALGIFIGSTFTEEGIILQQRGTIERMRANIDALQDEAQGAQGLCRRASQDHRPAGGLAGRLVGLVLAEGFRIRPGRFNLPRGFCCGDAGACPRRRPGANKIA